MIVVFHFFGDGNEWLLEEVVEAGWVVVSDDEDVFGSVEVGVQQCAVVGDEFFLPEDGFDGSPCDAGLVCLHPIDEDLAVLQVL